MNLNCRIIGILCGGKLALFWLRKQPKDEFGIEKLDLFFLRGKKKTLSEADKYYKTFRKYY